MWHRLMAVAALALAACGCEQQPQPSPAPPPAVAPSPAGARAVPTGVGQRHDPDRPNVVFLRGRSNTLEIELLQAGRQVPQRRGAYELDAAPFTLRLRGDVAGASYVATCRPDKTAPLEQVDRPLVFFAGSGGVWPGDSLHLMRDEPMSIHTADATFFHEQWIARRERAERLAEALRRTLGQTPAIATFRHWSLGFAGRVGAAERPLEEAFPLGRDEARADFRIETIGQMPAGQRPFVRLVLFLRSPIGQTFSQVAWATLDLRFPQADEQRGAETQPAGER